MPERFKPYAAILVLLIKDDKVLLMRRFNTGWADGDYTLLSGHIDEGESATAAAIRETREEIGVHITPKNISFAHILHRRNNQDGRVYMDFFFVVETWEGEPTICEKNKCDDLQWFKLTDLPLNVVPFVKDVIIAYAKSEPFSEVGWNKS